jgi:hypothetical protein
VLPHRGFDLSHSRSEHDSKIKIILFNDLIDLLNFVFLNALKLQVTEHKSVAMEDGDKVQRTEPNDLPAN